MRKIAISCTLLFMSTGLAMGQMAPASGYAFDQTYGNQGPRIVSTPTMSLDSPTPAVGATNATLGNVAGATNSTLAILNGSAMAGQVNSYGAFGSTEATSNVSSGESSDKSAVSVEAPGSFNSGIARSEYSEGVATLMADAGGRRKAARVYTNQDVERLNQENGNVKAGEKVEHLN